MIGKLTGTVDSITEDAVILDWRGWVILCNARLRPFRALQKARMRA